MNSWTELSTRTEIFELLVTSPVFLTCRVVTLVCSVLLWSNKCNNNNNKAETTSFIPVLAGRNLHMSQTLSHQRQDAWPTNCTPKNVHASVFFLYFRHSTLMNFEVGHFACHFLLLSFFLLVLLWNIQLHCHISFLLFICFLSSQRWLLDSCKRQLFCLHIQQATHCLFEWWTLVGSSEAAVCGFCLSISLQLTHTFSYQNMSCAT